MQLLLHTETFVDSAHHLRGYDGKCSRTHGHLWRIRVWIKGDSEQCDSVGILFDFGNIKKLQEKLDHYDINTIEPFDKVNPTAENLCRYFYEELNEMSPNLYFRVRVYETVVGKKTWCECGDF